MTYLLLMVKILSCFAQTKSGNTKIIAFVDKLSKMTRLVAAPNAFSAIDVARVYVHVVARAHGIVRNIVNDRDTLFNSAFWEELSALLGTVSSRSTAYHLQTDGQTERVNRMLEEMLRHYVSPHRMTGMST